MLSFTQENINQLIIEAKKSSKKRSHFPLHKHSDSVLKLMMAMEPETYIQPNKHSGKDCQELFICFKGKFIVLFFNEDGLITEHVLIGPEEHTLMVEVPVGVWHTMWPLVSGSVAMEVIKGPYDEKTYKEFATWAPVEGSAECNHYKEKILKELDLQ